MCLTKHFHVLDENKSTYIYRLRQHRHAARLLTGCKHHSNALATAFCSPFQCVCFWTQERVLFERPWGLACVLYGYRNMVLVLTTSLSFCSFLLSCVCLQHTLKKILGCFKPNVGLKMECKNLTQRLGLFTLLDLGFFLQ